MSTKECPVLDMPESDRRRWHLSCSIDLGRILVTIAMLAGFFVWAVSQDRRITTVEIGVKNEHEANVAQVSTYRYQDQTRQDLKTINDKLGRLLEARRK